MTDETYKTESTRSVRTKGRGIFGLGSVISVANGENCVLISGDSLADAKLLSPRNARKLADILVWQADLAEAPPPTVVPARKEDA